MNTMLKITLVALVAGCGLTPQKAEAGYFSKSVVVLGVSTVALGAYMFYKYMTQQKSQPHEEPKNNLDNSNKEKHPDFQNNNHGLNQNNAVHAQNGSKDMPSVDLDKNPEPTEDSVQNGPTPKLIYESNEDVDTTSEYFNVKDPLTGKWIRKNNPNYKAPVRVQRSKHEILNVLKNNKIGQSTLIHQVGNNQE